MRDRLRILIACLDWGLGHAARGLPVADALQELGATPILASAGNAGAFLRAERPELQYLALPAYNIHYRSKSMVASMALQGPKLAYTAWREHQLLQHYIKTHHIDGVISDNRFGCFSRKVPGVFLTHQLHPIVPIPLLQPVANGLNRAFLYRFQECWVPDLPGANGLSGALSHPPLAGIPTHYIGWLSRFNGLPATAAPEAPIDTLAVLSGPEPQRTHLEQALLAQYRQLPGRHTLVRGIPEEAPPRQEGGVAIINYLKGQALWEAIQNTVVVIGRPGYSSLMDWGMAQKKVLCIPTPGQTEQEYLAQRLYKKGRVAVQQQSTLQLIRGIEDAKAASGMQAADSGKLLHQNLKRFLATLPAASAD
ncbi:MAG: glycosyltransferase [bacterium]|nr:glycosyltransferase [bacterium]